MAVTVFTIGHSTHPVEEFIAILRAHAVEEVTDVRTIAKSRHNPQFGSAALAASLAAAQLGYHRIEALGGLRHTTKASINGAWRNASFRGYADYMQTAAFAAALDELIDRARVRRVAIMCAEAVPWRCHRSLIGDALLARGHAAVDIMTATSAKAHTLTSFARVDGDTVSYPPESA